MRDILSRKPSFFFHEQFEDIIEELLLIASVFPRTDRWEARSSEEFSSQVENSVEVFPV